MKILLLLTLTALLYSPVIKSQPANRIPGDIIIRLEGREISPEAVIQKVTGADRSSVAGIAVKKVLSNSARIFLLQNNSTQISDEQLLKQLSVLPEVKYAQFNYPVTFRNEPNDPSVGQQWYLDVIKAKQAWDITTGGLTARGDTIVIALVDKGCDLDHSDLNSNIWLNRGEIPDDGVDNDNNGYVDDFYGWRYDTDNDNHQEAIHGTQITGIMGAEGDNGNGIAGVNWHIKIMMLTMALNDGDIIAACYYAREMRERYTATGGAEGAFVVAANFSFGFDYAWPEDHPGWCDAFDDLGNSGIISAGATNNEAINVDTEGDIPSTCPSEFLIVVTNTTETDTKYSGAAWGPLYVDMGAPGTNIYSTTAGNDYESDIGTSFSTPMVAAAVALLYSLPSDKIPSLAMSDPVAAARLIRDFILDGVDKLSDLEGITVTGGRLNLFKSIEQAKSFVTVPNGDLDILKMYPNPTNDKLLLEYQTPGLYSYLVRIYDSQGKMVTERNITPYDDFNQPLEFDVHHFPTGVYTLTIHNFKQVVSRKFLVFPEDN